MQMVAFAGGHPIGGNLEEIDGTPVAASTGRADFLSNPLPVMTHSPEDRAG